MRASTKRALLTFGSVALGAIGIIAGCSSAEGVPVSDDNDGSLGDGASQDSPAGDSQSDGAIGDGGLPTTGPCVSGPDCASNSCLGGFCCSAACPASDGCNVFACTDAGACAYPTCPNHFTCGSDGNSCATSCAEDAGCATGYACNLALQDGGACVTPSATGPCSFDEDCLADAGGCVAFFHDGDGDGFGDPDASLKQCGITPPSTYVRVAPDAGSSSFDCDDQNVQAFPGQTSYFTAPRANNTYDYNCDGIQTLMNAPYSTCNYGCSVGTCATMGEQAGLAWTCASSAGVCAQPCTDPVTNGMTGQGTSCGTSSDTTPYPGGNSATGSGNATYTVCAVCTVAGGPPITGSGTGPQPCR